MNTRLAAPAAITILLAMLGGALISADEPSSPVPDEVVEAPAAVTEGAAGIGKDTQDAAVTDPEAIDPKPPSDISAFDSGFIASAPPSSSGGGRPASSSGGGRPGEDSDRAEMLLRLSASDRVSGIRMSVGEGAMKKIVDRMRKSNPNVNLEIDGNTIIARGSVADLRTLRSSLLTLVQTEDTKDLPAGLQVHVYGWREPRGASPEPAIPEKTTIIQLEHLPTSSASDVLRNLFPSPPNKVRIGTEPSTNTLILRGPTDQLEEFQAILLKLDQPSREPPQPVGSPFDRASTTQPDSQIQVYPLRHVLAQELSLTLSELFGKNIQFRHIDRTNSLFVNAPPEMLGRIDELVRQLDQPADTTAATRHNDAAKPQAAVEAEAEYAAAERRAAALATQTDTTVRDIRDIARLRAAVGQAFEWRQRRQRAELELLRARLKSIERDIERRDRIREAIIEHRVEELLKPELRWKPDEPPAAPDDNGLGATGVPPPLDGIVTAVDKGNLIAVTETELSEAERHFNHTEAMVKKGFQKQSDLEVARSAVESARARLHRARREYETKTRLLQLDVESAKLKVDAALKAFRQSSGPGQTSTEQQFGVRHAELELQRAQTLLDLHTGDLDESKDGEVAPQLEAPEQNAGPSEAVAEAAIWRSFGARVRAMSKVGMPGDRYNGGLIIRELRQDGPAAKAGLQQGDIIIGVRSWETLSAAKLLFALTSAETPGDSESERGAVKVLLLRKAEPRSATVVLDAAQMQIPADGGGFRPGGRRLVEGDSAASRDAQVWNEYGVTPSPVSALTAKLLEWIGLHLRPISKESFREKNVFANYVGGMDVTFVRSHGPAERAGVHEVDIVVRLQGQDTLTLANLDSAVQFAVDQIKRGDVDSLQFDILRNGETVSVNVPLPVERLSPKGILP